MKGGIDAHFHCTPNGAWFQTSLDASLGRVLKSADGSDLERIVLIAIEPVIPSSFVVGLCKDYPDLFLGFASVIPASSNALSEAQGYLGRDGVVGLTLHPRLLGFAVRDLLGSNLMEFANSERLLIEIDTYFFEDFMDLDQLNERYSSVRFVIPHAGGKELLKG